MIATVSVPLSVLEQALAACCAVQISTGPGGLNAEWLSSLVGTLDSTWAAVEKAVRAAFIQGLAAARTLIDESLQSIAELLKAAKQRAGEYHDILADRMRNLLFSYVQGAMDLLPATARIGGKVLPVRSVRCTQKIRLGGTLQLSLLSICETVASGELEIAIEYSASGSA